MDHLELTLLLLLVAITALTVLAQALRVPYPIVLVIGGSLIGFVPGAPSVALTPDLVLLIFLPPLLFHAAFFASPVDLRDDAGTIGLNAFGSVFATAAVVAVTVHATIDGLSWGAAFAFGAIVSPTDPLAAITIGRRLGVPRRVLALIEGESLANDGAALVAFGTAMGVAMGEAFHPLGVVATFVLDVLGGALVGWGVTVVVRSVLRRIDDDVLAITISLIAGYAAYLPAQELGVSGVIAAVTAGLIMGHRVGEFSGPGERLRGFAFWDVLEYVLNAVLFVLVGLQLPTVLERQELATSTLIGLGVLVPAVVIVARVVWVITTPSIVAWLQRRRTAEVEGLGWRARAVIAWSGLRGAVSLAAALSLPTELAQRDLLLFLTLCTIFGTLVLQGLSLPY